MIICIFYKQPCIVNNIYGIYYFKSYSQYILFILQKKQPKFISFHKTINLTKFKKIKDNY